MAVGDPAAVRITDREIHKSVVCLILQPDWSLNLYASKEEMLDAREDAAPVPAVDGLVNHPASLDVNLITRKDFIVDSTQQVEKTALFAGVGTGSLGSRHPVVSQHVEFISAPTFWSIRACFGIHDALEKF